MNKDKTRLTYQEQLKDPLWKQKREFIIEQRNTKCERCGDSENLQVHHKKYIKDRCAWEYDDELLECLCGSCHMKEHNIIKNSKEDTFGLQGLPISGANKILKLRALIIVNLKDDVISYLLSNSEILKITNTTLRIKVHRNYYNYLESKFSYCINVKNDYIDILIKKAVKDNNLMNFSK